MKLLYIVLAFSCLVSEAQLNRPRSVSNDPQHGTVNVFLAQRDSLVVVTDSMLTNVRGHTPTGIKLYQIDDRTICAMAGFYREAGPNSLDAFEAFIPSIIQDFKSLSSQSFQDKAQHLQDTFEDQLTIHFDALLTTISDLKLTDSNLILELTLAGYDLDGSLQIADITIRPKRTATGVSFESLDRPRGRVAPCEFAAGFKALPPTDWPTHTGHTGLVIHTVGDSFFCDIAGLSDVADELLAHPSDHSDLNSLNSYAQAKERGTILSLNDLRSLALFLVDQTVAAERKNQTFRVGGPRQIAVLSGGKIIEAPMAISQESTTGSALITMRLESNQVTCPSRTALIVVPATPSYQAGNTPDIQVNMHGCVQTIDGIAFHDSFFGNSTVVYYGAGPILFGKNNTVLNTTLLFGPKVNLDDAAVHKLVCDFKWKAVYKDSKELHMDCQKN